MAVFKDIFGKPLEHYKKEEMQKYIPAMCAWWDASIHISTNNDLVPESLTYKDFWSFPPMTDEQFMKSIEVTKRPPPVMKEGEIEEKAGSAPGKGGKKGTGKVINAFFSPLLDPNLLLTPLSSPLTPISRSTRKL